MRSIILLVIFSLYGCASRVVRDLNRASIDQGYKRVESLVCGNHSVGENGCVFPEGKNLGELKIFVVYAGSVHLYGCGNHRAYRYEDTGWFSIDLKEYLGERLTTDCSIDVLISPEFPFKLDFPVKGMMGTISLISCPMGVDCEFEATMMRLSQEKSWYVTSEDRGDYLMRSCGEEFGRGTFSDVLMFNLKDIVPIERLRSKDGCLAILSLKGQKKQKLAHKIWFYEESVIPVEAPFIFLDEGRITFASDANVTLSLVNDRPFFQKGRFKPSPEGDFLRFYTTQGRSLVVFIKDGQIVWSK